MLMLSKNYKEPDQNSKEFRAEDATTLRGREGARAWRWRGRAVRSRAGGAWGVSPAVGTAPRPVPRRLRAYVTMLGPVSWWPRSSGGWRLAAWCAPSPPATPTPSVSTMTSSPTTTNSCGPSSTPPTSFASVSSLN